MKRGIAVIEREVMQLVYLFILIAVALTLYLLLKSYARVDYDYSEVRAESLTESLKGCLMKDDLYSLENLRYCKGQENAITNYGAKIEFREKGGKEGTVFFNDIIYGNRAFCDNVKSNHICGVDDSFDYRGNMLRIKWVYVNVQK